MEAANNVLNAIAANIRDVIRLMSDSSNTDACLTKVDRCLARVDSLRGVVDTLAVEDTLRSLRSQLVTERSETAGQSSAEGTYCAERPLSGSRGRPKVQLETNQLAFLRDKGFTAVQIAKQLGCSASLVYKKLAADNLHMSHKYSQVTDGELDASTVELHQKHSNAGSEMMSGYLRASGLVVQRHRVRQSLKRVDTLGSAARWSRTVTRRTYSVPTPNSLWHLDAHMKLVRWGFVTHGCVDGYSRVITFLQTSTSNEAMVVLNLFAQACAKLGLPSRVRCDHGGENMDVAIFMTLVRGDGRSSVITGKSVHNQRIERLWRDVATQVTEYFYKFFYQFEDEGILDVDNETHLCALQLVFLPVINARINNFRQAWNRHRMRTEANRSPQQLWIQGMLQNANSGHVATAEVFDQPLSLLPHIEEALQHFNIDRELIQGNQGLQPPQPRYAADSDAVARVQAAIVSLTDMKDMYKTAVHILQNQPQSL